jgi:excisionase family DNA binding protein
MTSRLFDIPTTCAALGCGRTTVFNLIKSGQLRTVRIGRRRLVPTEAIDELIARFTESVEAP